MGWGKDKGEENLRFANSKPNRLSSLDEKYDVWVLIDGDGGWIDER